jgi:hypothetical protein
MRHKALRPLTGSAATILFATGLIGAGFLAIPVLTTSAAYAVAETLGFRHGLDQKPRAAKRFYEVITVSTLIGVLISFIGINPIKALFWTAVINGVISPPLLVVIMLGIKQQTCNGKPHQQQFYESNWLDCDASHVRCSDWHDHYLAFLNRARASTLMQSYLIRGGFLICRGVPPWAPHSRRPREKEWALTEGRLYKLGNRLLRRALFILVCTLVLSVNCRAQLPFYTDDTDTTPKGKFHLEVYDEHDLLQREVYPTKRQNTLVFTLNYGITDKLELDVNAPYITFSNSRIVERRNLSGIGDTQFGLKYNFLSESEGSKLPALAVVVLYRGANRKFQRAIWFGID